MKIDIQQLKKIISSDLPEHIMSQEIIRMLALQEDVLPFILELIENERLQKKEAYSEMNALLSKGKVIIEHPKLNKDKFFQKEVDEFYTQNSHIRGIFDCFKKKRYCLR